jgi:hypothetical protein
MNADVLQVLIDHGFSLGMHGHQHRSQFIDERFILGADRKITVISASTLCAGPTALPAGNPRGYNVLEIDNTSFTGRLHQRRMLNHDFTSPLWAPGQFGLTGTSCLDFQIQRPLLNAPGLEAATADLSAAEADIRSKRYPSVVTRLLKHRNNPLARPLLLESYVQMRDLQGLIRDFWPPQSTPEAIHVADALWERKDTQRLKELLERPLVAHSTDPSLRELREKYGLRL